MTNPVYGIHIWSEGDEWWDIAYKYTGSGLNWLALAWANPHILNTNKVPVGTRINIPEELTR